MKSVINQLRGLLRRMASATKLYRQKGFGFETIAAGSVAGVLFAIASSPSTIASLFGGQWPQYVPQAPFQIFSAIAGIGLAYETFHLCHETFHLYWLYRLLRKFSNK
jgi:hypothetical protein